MWHLPPLPVWVVVSWFYPLYHLLLWTNDHWVYDFRLICQVSFDPICQGWQVQKSWFNIWDTVITTSSPKLGLGHMTYKSMPKSQDPFKVARYQICWAFIAFPCSWNIWSLRSNSRFSKTHRQGTVHHSIQAAKSLKNSEGF